MPVILRNATGQTLEVDHVGAVVEPGGTVTVPGRELSDPADIAAALALPDGVEPNLPGDAIHILEPDGQLRAWPTATWAPAQATTDGES